MHKRERLFIRWSAADAALAGAAAKKLDICLSEFVRRATIAAAIEAVQRGTVPQQPATVSEE